jgi:hypothetical protein
MREEMQTLKGFLSAPGLEVLPMPTEGAAALLSDYAASQEFWLIVCDGFGFQAVLAVMDCHYSECEAADRWAYISEHKGRPIGVFVLRRKLMLARQYKHTLSRSNVLKTEGELLQGGALMIAADFNLRCVREFAASLGLETKAGDLAVSE